MSSVTASTTLPTDSTSLPSMPKLAFGVEIEIFVKPRPNLEGTKFRACLEACGWSDYAVSSPSIDQSVIEITRNRDALRFAIAEVLTQGGMEAWTPECCIQDDPYEKWTVCNEQLPEPPTFWGIELVSRVLHTEDDWQADIDKIFDILETYCEVKTTHACGTHVHVSPGRGQRFTDDQLRAICKGLTYFEQPLVAVLPGNRKENRYCLSNILHPTFGCESELQSAWTAIPTNSWAPVLDILGKISYQTLQSILGGISKDSAWNFSRCVNEGGSGTIECRRPPGIESAQQAKHWAGLVLGLFAQSMATDWTAEFERIRALYDHPSVSELECFVSRGLELLGTTCHDALVEEWTLEDTSKAITEEEIEDMVDEWAEENLRLRKEWRAKGLYGEDPFNIWDRDTWKKRRSGGTTDCASPTFQADSSWQYWGWDSTTDTSSPRSQSDSSWTDWTSNDGAQAEVKNSESCSSPTTDATMHLFHWERAPSLSTEIPISGSIPAAEGLETPNPTGAAAKVLFDWELTPGAAQDGRGPSHIRIDINR